MGNLVSINIFLARVPLVEFDTQDKSVEAKEYNEGTSQALNDHPSLQTEDRGLDGARVTTILQLESVDDPTGQVAEQQKVAHVAPRHAHGLGALGRYVLRKMYYVTINFRCKKLEIQCLYLMLYIVY